MTQITTGMLKDISSKLDQAYWRSKEKLAYLALPAETVEKYFRISVCTTCMDRLSDLKETLPRNMEDSRGYKNAEFILLDYNSRRDKVGNWVKAQCMEHIESGRLVYYRTEEPKFYSMAHSRNVALKLATGAIVQSVDADNFVGPSFLGTVNGLANAFEGDAAFFAKSKSSTHGRLGFFRRTFLEDLGGYDETFLGYGHDDRDIMYRAWALGFTLLRFGGDGASRIKSAVADRAVNYDPSGVEGNWRFTENWNKVLSYANLFSGNLQANAGRPWGKAKLVRNFSEKVEI